MTYRRAERLQQPDVEPAATAVQGMSVWVTGASRGLGLALARGLVSAGARVAMTSRPGFELERPVDELRDAGGEVLALPASVADSDGVDAAAGAIAAAWGALDDLVNAAGMRGGVEMLTRALALDWSQFNIRVNALAPGYFETQLTQGLRDSDRWRTALLDKTPLGRFGQPDELVGATAFLLSLRPLAT